MMKKYLLVAILTISTLWSFGQEALDTLFFVDGKIEAVQLTGLSESSVQYNSYGQGIPINTPKSKIAKVITRSGRIIFFENTAKKKTVFSAEDWEKVEITGIESEVDGLIRFANVSGKAKGVTEFSSLEKMQNRAMTKMRMQSAFLGCDVVFMLHQSNEDAKFGYYSSSTASSTLSGTAYGVEIVKPFSIVNGKYNLTKVYRLRPNKYEYEKMDLLYNSYTKSIVIDKNKFFLEEDYYSVHFNSAIPKTKDLMSLLSVTDNEIIFLVIDRSSQSKIKYYNLYFTKE